MIVRNLREGAVIGREVAEEDPDGNAVVHIRAVSGRMIDRAEWAGFLSAEEHQAASRLRDNWEQGRLCANAQAGGRKAQRNARSHAAERAWERHRHCFHHIGGRRAARALEAMVLYDEAPVAYGRHKNCDGVAALLAALRRLTVYFERHWAMWSDDAVG